MLRLTCRRLAVGAYTLFMMEQKHNPALMGISIAARGRMTGKLYRSLSQKDLAALKRRAAKHPTLKRRPPKSQRRRRKSAYQRFVSNHFNDRRLAHLPPSGRIKEIAKMWKLQSQSPVAARGGRAVIKTQAKKQIKKKKPSKSVSLKRSAPMKRKTTRLTKKKTKKGILNKKKKPMPTVTKRKNKPLRIKISKKKKRVQRRKKTYIRRNKK